MAVACGGISTPLGEVVPLARGVRADGERDVGSRGAKVTAKTRRRVIILFAGLAIALLPWLGILNVVLPQRHLVTHWPLAWVGFDVALAVSFGAVALGAVRRAPWLSPAVTAAGTLLLADAWFDVSTSAAGGALTLA